MRLNRTPLKEARAGRWLCPGSSGYALSFLDHELEVS
jgi:hypothetical protein